MTWLMKATYHCRKRPKGVVIISYKNAFTLSYGLVGDHISLYIQRLISLGTLIKGMAMSGESLFIHVSTCVPHVHLSMCSSPIFYPSVLFHSVSLCHMQSSSHTNPFNRTFIHSPFKLHFLHSSHMPKPTEIITFLIEKILYSQQHSFNRCALSFLR